MKIQLLGVLALCLTALVSCTETTTTTETTETTETADAPDYAAFDSNVELVRAFFKAHSAEDAEALAGMIADDIQWSGPNNSGNQYGGKEDFLAALTGYHEHYDNIKYTEGVVMPDSTLSGYWSGSVFPEKSATSEPEVIRIYGTWTATHVASGGDISLKYFSLASINDEGKFNYFSDYFDLAGLVPEAAAEE